MKDTTNEELLRELSDEELLSVIGGADNAGTTVNFDLNTYLFQVGAGAIFDGGPTTNVVNLSFPGTSIFTQQQ
ncbi:hypothetical protein [Nostoc sp. LPT]|uniref:hypothetical protein n=1 Tax=Nostoc sp. LPT TaxID=2815387 RepID=UPI001DE8B222|nr:hypothetical protein [Nostoc sp. LPT]MBN4003807.1 hypothetical protein [Nostoc sp. LPT]